MTRPSAPSTRSKVRRLRELARYDRSSVNAILDEATVCHVGFVDDGQPFVIPTAIARIGNHAYLHGSRVSRMLKLLAAGNPACITVTLLDGIVVARSAFNSSMNYRSVTEQWQKTKRKAAEFIASQEEPVRHAHAAVECKDTTSFNLSRCDDLIVKE